MRLTDLADRSGEWLRGSGADSDVVISSRVRLARNIAGRPFLRRCTPAQQQELAETLHDKILAAKVADNLLHVDVAAAEELDRRLLVERHLISRQLAEADHPRGVVLTGSETLAIMINEEDHLRLQVLRSGLELLDAMEEINRVDNLLETQFNYAYHTQYGYLTACPTNVGTGLRVSVMLHLPALKMSGEIEKTFRAARDMRLAIRGLYGEGTEATGDFFQVSNQTTLGRSEQQIVEEFGRQIIPDIIACERTAREQLLRRRRAAVDDKIARADALLRHARTISSSETLYLLSLVRLGVASGRISDVKLETVNRLFLQTQPAHLQRILHRSLTGEQRAEARAQFVRSCLQQRN